jgi:hypothetical protein
VSLPNKWTSLTDKSGLSLLCNVRTNEPGLHQIQKLVHVGWLCKREHRTKTVSASVRSQLL